MRRAKISFSSGTFSLVAGNPVVTGTTISSTVQNNTMNDVATGLSTCILKDGTQTTTATIPIAGSLTVVTSIGIGATGKIYLDGIAMTGDTYILETSANVLDFYAGGAKSLSLTATSAIFVGGINATSGLLQTAASATGGAGFRLAHGTAPTSPVNGDMWTTTSGLFVYINGTTKTVTLT